eukprot:jgi/Mesvir1/14770/Mv05411-RA.1
MLVVMGAFWSSAAKATMHGPDGPVLKDLVLVGGGHSHVSVLKSFGMNPVPGVRLTLITRDVHTPYSGMLPGYIAGHYDYDDCHIDLRPLATFAGARLIHAPAIGLDLEEKKVEVKDRPPVSYDVVSIDIGITPSKKDATGAAIHTTAVKPIDSYSARWNSIAERVMTTDKPVTLAVVGGGAGGLELALAMQFALQSKLKAAGRDPQHVKVELFTSNRIMESHNKHVQKVFRDICKKRGLELHENWRVSQVTERTLTSVTGAEASFDECVWCTQGGSQPWLKESGLSTDADGFICVNDYLQSPSHEDVFAAGDITASINHPRPKAGVFAVRQGPPLTENLRRRLQGQPLKRFKPQKQFLGLISTGDKYAVASRGPLCIAGIWGALLWKWKDWIDRKFMLAFSHLPMKGMMAAQGKAGSHHKPSTLADGLNADIKAVLQTTMRCGGCGSKVGASVLSRVLKRLDVPTRPEVVAGLDAPDDAAIVKAPDGMYMVQTVDFFRSFINDPFTFGAIAAVHALSDCHAMGAMPVTALALATVPHGLPRKVEEDLYLLMAGAVQVLKEENCALVGGHTSEGSELGLGFSVNGVVAPKDVLRKGGMRPGELLILTKPLGTGTLMAADMRGKAKGRWVMAALASMRVSNAAAAEVLRAHGASACTDVTGFGLIGHLVEMVRPSHVAVSISAADLPILEGALDCLRMGIESSLAPDNKRAINLVSDLSTVSTAAQGMPYSGALKASPVRGLFRQALFGGSLGPYQLAGFRFFRNAPPANRAFVMLASFLAAHPPGGYCALSLNSIIILV